MSANTFGTKRAVSTKETSVYIYLYIFSQNSANKRLEPTAYVTCGAQDSHQYSFEGRFKVIHGHVSP